MTLARGAPAFLFVDITLDGGTLRFSNAFQEITFDGQVYEALGDRLTPPDDIDRTASLKSQKFTLSFDSSRQTDNADIVGRILDAQWKRRPIRVRYAAGAMGTTGYDFSAPFVIFDETGRINDLEDTISAGDLPALEMEIESGALVFLERRNQTRSPANQRAAFPGDAFFDLAQKLDGVVLPWRTKRAKNGKTQITYDVDGVAPRQLLYGRGKTAGSFVFGCTIGEQRKYWNQVYALADHQCEALEEIYINGNPALSGTVLEHGVKTALSLFSSGGGRLWATWYDGRHDQTANAYLVSGTAGQALQWTSSHRGRGVSYVIIEHLWDSDNPESFSYEFVLRGARVYQERYDSTAGGSGAHRINDPATWQYTTNAEDALRHYLRGRVVAPGSDFKWFGVAAPLAFLDPYADHAARAAHADDLVNLSTGGTEPRYEANGWISAADSHAANVRKLADAMVADAVDEGGRVSIRLSEPQTPVAELLDGDLVADADSVLGANARADDVVNRIEGRYFDPNNKFTAVDYPPVSSAEFEEIDGAELEGTWNQELEISEERATRKATLYLNKQRRTVETEETFGLAAKDIRPGDWIIRKSVLRGFPDGKTFIADEVRRFTDGTVRLILLEVDPGELVWNEETFASGNVNADIPVYEGPEIAVPVISVSAVSLSGGGVVIPAARFTITNFADAMGDEVICEFGIWNGLTGASTGIAGPVSYFKIPGNVAAFDGLAGLLPGTGYAFRFRAREGERSSVWSSFVTITSTGTYQAGRSEIADSIFGQGWGATASEEEASNALVPGSSNGAIDSRFIFGFQFWGDTYSSAGTWLQQTFASAGRLYLQRFSSAPPAGAQVNLGGLAAVGIPVTPGQRIEASAIIGFGGMSARNLVVNWFDSAGAYVSTSVVVPSPANYARCGDFVLAPGGVAFATPGFVGIASGAADAFIHFSEPLIRVAGPAQTALTPFEHGLLAEPGANITGDHIAAGIDGQGALATLSQAQWATQVTGVGKPEDYATLSRVYRSSSAPSSPNTNDIWVQLSGSTPIAVRAWNGSAWITGADITAFNIASGIDGQGALATLSQAQWATQVTGVGKPEDYATLSRVYRSSSAPSSPNTNDIWVQLSGSTPIAVRAWNGSVWITGADITGVNIAAGFDGQDWGATASESDASNALVPGSNNAAVDSSFLQGFTFWNGLFTSAGTWLAQTFTSGGKKYLQRYAASAPAGAQANLFSADFAALPVTEGQRVEISALLAYGGFSSVYLAINWLDGSRAYVSTSNVLTNPTNFSRRGGFAPTPPGAAFATLGMYGTGAVGGEAFIQYSEPLMRVAADLQTALTPYTPGPPDLKADETGVNISAGYDGQGPWGTFSRPVTIVTWISDDGQINHWRGLPTNASAGQASVVSASPFSYPSIGDIEIAAHTRTLAGQEISMPSGTITGLLDDTKYFIFRDLVAGTYIHTDSISVAKTYLVDVTGRYVFLGTYRTRTSAGGGGAGGSGGGVEP